MRTISDSGSTTRDAFPVLAAAAVAVGGIGAVLALVDLASPLRAPFTVFFLIAAPAVAVAAGLPGLDPLSRSVAAVTGAAVVDVLTAQAMLALRIWSVRGGVLAIGALSLLLFLLACVRRRRDRSVSTRAR
jgi:hypothetical protein